MGEPAPLRWRLVRDGARTGARNMARDHALACGLGAGEGVVRFYRWSSPTLSLGRNEPALGLYSPEAATSAGIPVVRRPTGGRAVLHWRELTYAVVVPAAAWGGPRRVYFAINEALAAGLRTLGAPAAVVRGGSGGTPAVDAGPCFKGPAPGEIAVGGRKLVGSAQVRLGGVLLQHGSILLEDDQPMLARVGPGVRPDVGPATLREVVGDVNIDDLTDAVAKSLRAGLGGAWTDEGLRSAELEAEERWEAARYGNDSWTWRR